ncbi:MAG: hypothetical protein ABJL99_03385 [Aliishimia sp.]
MSTPNALARHVMGVERVDINRMVLSATDRAPVRAILPEIKDAFRTTSWPLPPGTQGIIQIRKLDMGRIARGASRQSLSRHLSDVTRHLPLTIYRRGTLIPNDVAAVHWPGPAERLAAVLIAQAKGGVLPWWVSETMGRGGQKQGSTPGNLARFLQGLPPEQRAARLGALLVELADQNAPKATALPVASGAKRALAVFPDLVFWFDTFEVPQTEPNQDVDQRHPASVDQHSYVILRKRFIASIPLLQRTKIANWIAGASLSKGHELAALTAIVMQCRGLSAVPELLARQVTSIPKHWHEQGGRRPSLAQGQDKKTIAQIDTERDPEQRTDPSAKTPIGPTSLPRLKPPIAAPVDHPEDLIWPEYMTRLGGVPIMINLLHLTGVQHYDQVLQQTLCLQVFNALLLRAGYEGDAMHDALIEPLLSSAPVRGGLPVIYPSVTALACGPSTFYLTRIAAQPGRWALCLRPSGVVIGILNGAAFGHLREQLPKTQWRVAGDTLAPEVVHLNLARGLQILLQRVCFHLCQQSWRQVLHRPAWLDHSATHVDVTCDLNDVRIAERRSGLDVSPGWVAWFARVVSLHFERLDTTHPMPEVP